MRRQWPNIHGSAALEIDIKTLSWTLRSKQTTKSTKSTNTAGNSNTMRVITGSMGLLGLAMLDTANSSPLNTNVVSDLECLAVEVVVDVLHAYSSATPFCSSFLQIPTATSTATATSSVPTTTVITATTGTNTITADAVTSTETS